jgi:hypothetical protein
VGTTGNVLLIRPTRAGSAGHEHGGFGMNEPDSKPETRVALFQKREIRRTIHNNEWWCVITDIIAALTDSTDPSGY